MDVESGILAALQADNSVSVSGTDSQVTLTDLPITEDKEQKPTVHGLFKQPVAVRAITLTLMSPSRSTTSQPGEKRKPVGVRIVFYTTKSRDTDISTPSDDVNPEPKVSPPG